MADNYLERRMDDLRNGRLHKSTPSPRTAPGAGLFGKYPPRRVVVTGGANGIGLEITRTFLRAGCKVAVIDIDAEAGLRLASGEGVRFCHADVADPAALEQALDSLFYAWRDVDIIVSNAGIFRQTPLESDTAEEFDRALDINLRPAYLMARWWAKWRRDLPYPNPYGGRMVLIGSTRHLQSESGTEGYTASKGGIAALTHALMMSLAEWHITVNCISPGWIHTGADSELSEADARQHPSGRVGRPADVARLALFLTLPDNDFINGADIPVDGGMTRRMIYI